MYMCIKHNNILHWAKKKSVRALLKCLVILQIIYVLALLEFNARQL